MHGFSGFKGVTGFVWGSETPPPISLAFLLLLPILYPSFAVLVELRGVGFLSHTLKDSPGDVAGAVHTQEAPE